MNIYNSLISFTSSVWSGLSYALCGRAKPQALDNVVLAAEQAIRSSASFRGGASASPPPRVEEEKKEALVDPTISWKKLQPKSVFIHEGAAYQYCQTVGDGACAIHAILGRPRPSDGLFAFEGKDNSWASARNHYVDQLKEQGEYSHKSLQNLLKQLLLDFLRDGMRAGRESQLIFNLVPASFIHNLQSRLLNYSQRNLSKTEHQQLVENDCLNSCRSQEVEEAYYKACLDKGYYFTEDEVEVMAHLFNKRIKVFISGEEGYSVPMLYNESGKDPVAIYLNPGHYSRLETI